MSKKIILFLTVVVFFSGYHLARADVIIDEFVSHPASGNEWVELFNNGATAQDLTGWTIKDLSNSPESLSSLGIIPANGIVVFEHASGWLNDNPTTETITIFNNTGAIVYSISYGSAQGVNITAPSIGKSGALISGVWQTNQDPTKGAQNPNSSIAPAGGSGLVTSDNPDNNTSSATTTTPPNKTEPKETPIETKITVSENAFAGIPLVLQASAFGHQAEPLNYGKYFWNFGDGDSKEVQLTDMNNNQKVTHTYFYPGEYNVSLEYSLNYYAEAPDASDKITIKVVLADISISNVGDDKDFFVELSNNTDYDADISNWVLESNAKSFTIPRNTIIGSKNKISISGKITNFSITDKDTLKLITSEGDTAYDYTASIVSIPVAKTVLAQNSPLEEYSGLRSEGGGNASTPSRTRAAPQEGNNSTNQIPLVNLSSAVVSSGILQNNGANNSQTTIIFLISIIFIGAGAGAVYFVRQKKVIPEAGNDFEILDE